ncbi:MULTISPECIES: hypothetical protein [unclassified Streptomyces]|uniref:hypothetical protein n=1 Tax=unclassified Streptomyces TaxID=2593676 RepID=UPI0035E0B8B0
MNHVTGPQAADVESQYHAEFAMGAHSARHLRRVLRLYLVRSGLSDVTDAAEPALTELVADGCPELPVPATVDTLSDGGQGKTVWFECVGRADP